MEKKKIVFLYSELAAYFLACIEELSSNVSLEIHIVKWPLNKEAPFHFNFNERISFYNREDYNDTQLLKLVNEIAPDLIYSSGWMDKGYLQVCKKYRNKIPVVVGFDNQWKGTLKQYLACFASWFKIHPYFSHCWVPGKAQEIYALKLGFNAKSILSGFYCCDFNFFNGLYHSHREQKSSAFPKRFIYTGRYVAHKGIQDLWDAFIQLEQEMPNEWELWCLGTGEVAPVQHSKIKHFGFVQPVDLPNYIKDTGVFILPSHFEPWGVVVHEFAAAGYPIICSNEVGAKEAFVEHDFNGYIYNAGDVSALKSAMKKMITRSDAELLKWSERSVEKARLITPAIWSQRLMSIL